MARIQKDSLYTSQDSMLYKDAFGLKNAECHHTTHRKINAFDGASGAANLEVYVDDLVIKRPHQGRVVDAYIEEIIQALGRKINMKLQSIKNALLGYRRHVTRVLAEKNPILHQAAGLNMSLSKSADKSHSPCSISLQEVVRRRETSMDYKAEELTRSQAAYSSDFPH
ncbi:hypothetical protein Tco_1005714 [Tanacetum coccineum]|uniref:Reverse transcriptase Ty1/copia-type domain-containing protein n=1 Tax=Tanacetum coccineum TaxID=301880 RepID=A0ABQ5FFI6_9ASTR